MPRVEKRSVLSGISVKEAMRRQVIQLPQSAAVDYCINRMIKYKVNSVLITDEHQNPVGVVSKTDVMSAFYAAFPISTPVENIMVGPPLFCYPDDELELSLDAMQQNGVHRLYVRESDSNVVVGVLAYPDIVGLLYRYCRACDKGLLLARRRREEQQFRRLKVKDVMTATVTSFPEEDKLTQVIEGLTAHRFGAVLIKNALGKAVGVVSKSDLIVAYKHGVTVYARAAEVMSKPVVSCGAQTDLAEAIQQMLLRDVQRLFVHANDPGHIVGILSLSDAARFRSGSCRACTPSRFMQE
ncbi:MAG: CBS domain-containing protein [Desulfobacterales bacterium]|nr:MAG: CBS domain-containing protein [Desulfobacterales bacterium]